MKRFGVLAGLLLAGCVDSGAVVPVTRPGPTVPVPPPVAPAPNITALYGADARALSQRFGQPQLDLQEGTGRKLQFGNPTCVLDAYLYPPKSGHGEPVVTHVDARQRNGGPIDAASCVAALTRR